MPLSGILRWLSGKEYNRSAGDAGDEGLILGSGTPPGGGNGNPLQYSCLQNPSHRGAWQATVRGVTKSQTRLQQLSTRATTVYTRQPPFPNPSHPLLRPSESVRLSLYFCLASKSISALFLDSS